MSNSRKHECVNYSCRILSSSLYLKGTTKGANVYEYAITSYGCNQVSFEVEKGEFLGIMGASGSGKTTLLNVLSTIDIPTSGHIIMGKTHIEKLGQGQAADFRKNNLGFIFQEYFLLDSLTVRENIAVPLTLLHKPAKELTKR